MLEALSEPFVQRALIAASLLGPLCAFLGVFVTARGYAFFSDTVSHAALAGVALGIWLGFKDPSAILLLFVGLVALVLMWLRQNTELHTDTLMALLLSGSVSFGLILLSLVKERRAEIHGYLFGDILALGPNDIYRICVLFLLVGGLVIWQLSPLTLFTANEDLAHVSGIPVARFRYLFAIILAITVAASIRLMGIILVTSLLVIPAATARNLSRTLRQQILLSLLCGAVCGVAGTLLGYWLDTPCGPSIVMANIITFVFSLGVAGWRHRSAEQPR